MHYVYKNLIRLFKRKLPHDTKILQNQAAPETYAVVCITKHSYSNWNDDKFWSYVAWFRSCKNAR